jgi:MYXO-CTERM domain-containing protein
MAGLGARTRRSGGRKATRAVVAAVVVFAGMTAARPASAYCRTTTCPACDYDDKGCPAGTPIAWPTSCVTFSMQIAGSKQVELSLATNVMDEAFRVWQEVTCPDDSARPSIKIDRRYGHAACMLHEYNQTDANANIIMFRDDVWPYDSANVLALTTVTYRRNGGVILDVDMEVNATQRLSIGDPVPPTSYDLQSIMTHEAGHFFGLAHSTEPSATMWPRYTSGTQSFRELATDDGAGICAVYPPNAAAQCNPAPQQGFSPECGIYPSGPGGHCAITRGTPAGTGARPDGWLALAAAFGSLLVRRRRCRPPHSDER